MGVRNLFYDLFLFYLFTAELGHSQNSSTFVLTTATWQSRGNSLSTLLVPTRPQLTWWHDLRPISSYIYRTATTTLVLVIFFSRDPIEVEKAWVGSRPNSVIRPSPFIDSLPSLESSFINRVQFLYSLFWSEMYGNSVILIGKIGRDSRSASFPGSWIVIKKENVGTY